MSVTRSRPGFYIRYVATEKPWWVYHDGQKVGETMPVFMGNSRDESVEWVDDMKGVLVR